jgi:hypothetical protein
MKEGREKEAVTSTGISVKSGSVNQNQKGRSYLALAVHYFDKPDYIELAGTTTVPAYFMDQKHPTIFQLRQC